MERAEGRRWARAGRTGPLVIAHRGASAHATENTLDSFRRALQDGADGVELDVVCCASGEAVVFHDEDLRRLAGRPERVAELSLLALRRVKLPGGTGIPTLEEALEVCGPTALMNVELKSRGLLDRQMGALVERVGQAIDLHGAAPRVLVSSFDPRAVWFWQRKCPEVKSALLLDRGGLAAAAKALTLPWLRPFAVHPAQTLCHPALVARWHALGYVVNAWTVDAPARARALRDAAVDGIMTNDPASVRAALNQV
jgi:glycerophosphoryl diester phosphodiesterase